MPRARWAVLVLACAAGCAQGSSTGTPPTARGSDAGGGAAGVLRDFTLRYETTPDHGSSGTVELLQIAPDGSASLGLGGHPGAIRRLAAADLERLARVLASPELAAVVRRPKNWGCGDCDRLTLAVSSPTVTFTFEWETVSEDRLPLPPVIKTLHRELDAVKQKLAPPPVPP